MDNSYCKEVRLKQGGIMKKFKKQLLPTVCILLSLIAILAGSFVMLRVRTGDILDDYKGIFSDEKYAEPVYVDGVDVVKQNYSCGYASMEMFSEWAGADVTEAGLYEQYGRTVTATGDGFCKEMNKQFPEYKTTIHKYMKNSRLIDTAYSSLSAGYPVPFEWAAKCGDEWTLHYSLIVGMDIPGDKITVANPYGYTEEISVDEFLSRTSFEAFDDMPWFIEMGFAVGLFEKNTIFTVEKV